MSEKIEIEILEKYRRNERLCLTVDVLNSYTEYGMYYVSFSIEEKLNQTTIQFFYDLYSKQKIVNIKAIEDNITFSFGLCTEHIFDSQSYCFQFTSRSN
ncbi:hypothetical protein [Vibrio owensii]|uniref:Uncharacterized protein n=1 Tax=Vibrio owensii CAIM 1854 = LMG 25443 TaxID=1229493 RepID=A0A0C1V6J2_9VIBR|nr:hypothetical protein [Vibrio owensii]KIF45318.1 hypothetical protein H735_29705 [Vibrio owensii CAIM 1854 = LMG 25443]